MTMGHAMLVVLVAFLAMVAVMPVWPWSRAWGARPVIAIGLCFLMVAVFAAIGGFTPI